MKARGWDQCDFIYICGDAYVDHPSFGAAIICRLLEAHGYKVGFIPNPTGATMQASRRSASLACLPRLGGQHGLHGQPLQREQAPPPHRHLHAGGRMGARPDHATIVYGNLIRRTFKNTPIILGGIEASLRRLAHYDYWQDRLKRSVLLDSGSDLIIYGMGERPIIELAEALDAGLPIEQITYIDGTVYRTRSLDEVYDAVVLPSGRARGRPPHLRTQL